MASHLIFQLVLPVHFMLSDVKVVSWVVVHRLYKAERENIQVIGDCGSFRMEWTPSLRQTYSSLSKYGSSSGGSGGDGGGLGGGGAPQGCWLLLPRVSICWKLMSVWVQLSTQSAIPMVIGANPAGAPVKPARLRAPRRSMLDSTGSRMSRVGSPERRDNSFPFTWKTQIPGSDGGEAGGGRGRETDRRRELKGGGEVAGENTV